MPEIPFLDMKSPYLELQAELDEAWERVMRSGWYILGQEVEAFEQEFARYVGTKYCIGVGNGLEALHLILRAYGIGAGDEVIVPSNTYIATWLAVSYAGARLVPVEPVERAYNLDPERIEAAITPQTKAILAVHLYGQTADMDGINAVAQKHVSRSSKTQPRRMARGITANRLAAWAMPPVGVSIPARTSARWAMREPSPPMTPSWPIKSAPCATMARR